MSELTDTLTSNLGNQSNRLVEQKRSDLFFDLAALITKHFGIANPIEDPGDFVYEPTTRRIVVRLGQSGGDQHLEWPTSLLADAQSALDAKVLTEFPDAPDPIGQSLNFSD